MRDGKPYLLACGYCHVAVKVHPVKQCPYIYKARKHRGRIVGYSMKRKN